MNLASKSDHAPLDLSHTSPKDFLDVYEPDTDTFTLLDALLQDKEHITQRQANICVEVGCGSGVNICYLAQLLSQQETPARFIATDINPKALALTQRTAEQYKVTVETVETDLVSSLRPEIDNKCDIIVMNPPYVVTPSEEISEGGIAAAWAGGVDGREVIDRFIPQVKDLLHPDRGTLYLLLIEENKPAEVCAIFHQQGLKADIILQRQCINEFVSILRVVRTV